MAVRGRDEAGLSFYSPLSHSMMDSHQRGQQGLSAVDPHSD